MAAVKDEFQERARLAAEAQELARGYSNDFGSAARTALLIGIAGIAIMCLAWLITGPEFNHNSSPPPLAPVIVHPSR